MKRSLLREYALFLFLHLFLQGGLARGQNSSSPPPQKNPPAVLQPDGCSPVPGTLRDSFNRPDAALPGANKWSLIQNQPNAGSMAVVSNALRPTSGAGAYNFGGVVWDTLVGAGTEASLSVLQKSGNTAYTSLFLYARMNNKDYASGTGYRLRFLQQAGSDLIEIDRVGPGYTVFTSLAQTTHTINPGDILTFRVLCDNRTMLALANGVQILSVSDSIYSPPQWYFALRSCVFPTPVIFDNFSVSSQSGGTVLPPSAPTLASPANGAGNQSISPTVTWNPSSGAVSYRLQVSADSLFGSLILNDSTLTATSRQLSSLSNSKKYFWRVNAKNGSGTSAYSLQWAFTTIAAGNALVRHLEYAFPDGWIYV
ncbi:MAG: fibronectin type III domain-containing protein, partial [Ignavibacteria bacterium]